MLKCGARNANHGVIASKGDRFHWFSLEPWCWSLIFKERNSVIQGLSCGSEVKEYACYAGAPGSIPELGRSPREGNGNPLQHSCLENPMNRGAWWAIVHEVTKQSDRTEHSTHTDTHRHTHTHRSSIISGSWCSARGQPKRPYLSHRHNMNKTEHPPTSVCLYVYVGWGLYVYMLFWSSFFNSLCWSTILFFFSSFWTSAVLLCIL